MGIFDKPVQSYYTRFTISTYEVNKGKTSTSNHIKYLMTAISSNEKGEISAL